MEQTGLMDRTEPQAQQVLLVLLVRMELLDHKVQLVQLVRKA